MGNRSNLQMTSGVYRFFIYLLLLGLFPAQAMGHAFPDHSDPKVGSTVVGSPLRVQIWFDGALEPAFCVITVQNAAGKRVDKGNGHVSPSDPALLETSLASLPPGVYRVIWNVVARDGHRTAGDYSFSVK